MWEEGTISGSRVTRLSVLACAIVILIDLIFTRGLSPLFDGGFVLVCVGAALLVHPRDFFRVGVLPPMLMLGFTLLVGIFFRSAIANAGDGLIQGVITGLAHHAGALFVGYALALVVLGIRHKMILKRARQVQASKRETSPAPTRVTSAMPEEKSTTVVGSEPVSPASITASNQ